MSTLGELRPELRGATRRLLELVGGAVGGTRERRVAIRQRRREVDLPAVIEAYDLTRAIAATVTRHERAGLFREDVEQRCAERHVYREPLRGRRSDEEHGAPSPCKPTRYRRASAPERDRELREGALGLVREGEERACRPSNLFDEIDHGPLSLPGSDAADQSESSSMMQGSAS